MRPIFQKIIGPFQNSFLAGISRADNILITQEIVHTMMNLKGKKGSMVLKLDIHKAFDTLSWDFLRATLVDFNLPTYIVNLLMFCVSHMDISILWNGECLPSFTPGQGLRQGDPLSPYLFILAMEKLSHMILQRVNNGSWKPIKAARGSPPISHLFFADHLMLFAHASIEQMSMIHSCIEEFSGYSNLIISPAKSKLFVSPNVSRALANQLSSISGIPITDNLGTYLGLPIIHGRVLRESYSHMIDKILKRLADWKGKLLSPDGRRTLIQSTTSSIPLHTMQTALLPMSTCQRLDQINPNFLWNDLAQPTRIKGEGRLEVSRKAKGL